MVTTTTLPESITVQYFRLPVEVWNQGKKTYTTYHISYHNIKTKIYTIDLAGYILNVFEYKPVNIVNLIDIILSDLLQNNWDNSIFHAEHKILKPWVEYN